MGVNTTYVSLFYYISKSSLSRRLGGILGTPFFRGVAHSCATVGDVLNFHPQQ